MKYTHVGQVKKTDGQIKKHVSQFTEKEFRFLNSIVRGRKTQLSHHAKLRTSELNISCNKIKESLKSFNIIEFNYKEVIQEARVLIRSTKEFRLDDGQIYNLCCVISLTENHIVTLYWNLAKDDHSTINFDRYQEIDIMRLAYGN